MVGMGLIQDLVDYAKTDFAGNPLWRWALAVATAAATFGVLLLGRALLRRHLAKTAERTGREGHRLLARMVGRLWATTLLITAAYVGRSFLILPNDPEALDPADVLRSALIILLLVQMGLWASEFLAWWLERRLRIEPDAHASTAVVMLGFGGKLLIWSMVFITILKNGLHIEPTGFLTGLGIGGIAIALAAQSFLGDALSSVAIAIDKPFELGDHIAIDHVQGRVESIGLKTTRIRSVTGEQVVISNSDLLKSRLRNFKRMQERRMSFTIGVAYETAPDQLEAIPPMLRKIVEGQENVRFERASFIQFGEVSLVFEVVFFVLSGRYDLAVERQQAILIGVARQFAAAGIRFAAAKPVPTPEPPIGEFTGRRRVEPAR